MGSRTFATWQTNASTLYVEYLLPRLCSSLEGPSGKCHWLWHKWNNPIKSDHIPITLKLWDWNSRNNKSQFRRIRIDRLQNPTFRKLYQEELIKELVELRKREQEGIERRYEEISWRHVGKGR
ncbi:unnamed protein product [Blepharisma stoltei]|uniref:Uncharacterized protein n=1 Tax=Blepharisma stoltei TaxID=1481888 RepID=A0AAU9K800_9CILI|nr:unnamed protein product [Blepharisma stoltei]